MINPPFNISANDIKFGTCFMECDSTLSICEESLKQLAIVQLWNGEPVVKRIKMIAEAATMCPGTSVIALRGNTNR